MSITITNNPDGSYTVTCGSDSVTVGGSAGAGSGAGAISFPPLSASGGGVTAHIIDLSGLPARGKRVDHFDDIIADLGKRPFDSLGMVKARPRVLEYTLRGQHSIDVGRMEAALRKRMDDASSVQIHVFVGTPRE